jgi:RimJ/RimL family protein N-acetyltransferase
VEDDAEWYVAERDELVFRWTSEPRDLTVEVARDSIASSEDVPGVYGFAIADRFTGELIGHLPVTVNEHVAEIAYWLGPAKRGRGSLSDALCVVIEWLVTLKVTRVVLEAHPDNVASRRAAERAGFTYIGEHASTKRFADTGRVVVYELVLPRP